MNTRQEIQPPPTDFVTSIAFTYTSQRFVCGMGSNVRAFRLDNAFTTYLTPLPFDDGVSIAEALDDRCLGFVCAHKGAGGGPNVVVFWDLIRGHELNRFDLHEPIKGLRISLRGAVVILQSRTVFFQWQELEHDALHTPTTWKYSDPENPIDEAKERLRAPNKASAIYQTAANPFGLACLSKDVLALPAETTGQVQIVYLNATGSSTKRILRAHNSTLRCMKLSPDGSLLATASEQGTLIRVYDSHTLEQIGELRRGMDHATISSLAFSSGNRWLAATSDKGTLHVFDLRPSDQPKSASEARQHRKSQSYASHRLSGTGYDKDSISGTSAGHSSPAPSTAVGTGMGGAYQGSVQEYYGLRPPPASASPPARETVGSLMAAFKSSSLAPRIVKDTRSVASDNFYVGNEPSHWQGGPAQSWTTGPQGTRQRVTNPVVPLPNDPAGKPPKGVLCLAPTASGSNDDEGAIIHVIGGGTDPRWEKFELLPDGNGGWRLENKGFRKYLTRQFPE